MTGSDPTKDRHKRFQVGRNKCTKVPRSYRLAGYVKHLSDIPNCSSNKFHSKIVFLYDIFYPFSEYFVSISPATCRRIINVNMFRVSFIKKKMSYWKFEKLIFSLKKTNRYCDKTNITEREVRGLPLCNGHRNTVKYIWYIKYLFMKFRINNKI